jgi:hypothetical protein
VSGGDRKAGIRCDACRFRNPSSCWTARRSEHKIVGNAVFTESDKSRTGDQGREEGNMNNMNYMRSTVMEE